MVSDGRDINHVIHKQIVVAAMSAMTHRKNVLQQSITEAFDLDIKVRIGLLRK